MGVAIAGGRRMIPGQRIGHGSARPHLYLVPPLPEDNLARPVASDDPPDVDSDGVGWDEPIPYELADGRRVAMGATSRGATRHGEPTSRRPADPWGLPPTTVRTAIRGVGAEPRLAPQAGRRPLRLTRRGRVVVWLILLGLMVGVVMLLAPAIQASTPAGPVRTVVVAPGDTLWSISIAALPSEDPYQAVDQVRRLNHMETDAVFVGQQLKLPPAK